jgi:hypothetical protein
MGKGKSSLKRMKVSRDLSITVEARHEGILLIERLEIVVGKGFRKNAYQILQSTLKTSFFLVAAENCLYTVAG